MAALAEQPQLLLQVLELLWLKHQKVLQVPVEHLEPPVFARLLVELLQEQMMNHRR